MFPPLKRKEDLAVFQSQKFSVPTDGRAVISLLLKWKKDIHQLLELGAKIDSSCVVKAIQSSSFSIFVKHLNAVNNKKKHCNRKTSLISVLAKIFTISLLKY